MTVDISRRKQFGVTIGSFQALQHRAADMTVALEQARSMMYLAAGWPGEDDAEGAKTMSAVKANRPVGQVHRPAGGANARRHRDDLWYKAGHLFASDDDRYGLRRRGRSRARLADPSSLFA
jgi:alkylation response protein AidB-like acyl-CoA dehydrogenase